MPIVVYSVQGRTGVNVEPATLSRLAQIENIVGVKEASGNIAQMANVIHEVPSHFNVLSGDDSITIPLMALGGRGVISVVSNEIPGPMAKLAQACLRGDFETARAIQARYLALMNVNFVESNPIPVKAALGLMGLLDPVYRLPMCAPSASNLAKIEKVLESVGLAGSVPVAG
jgi:4-hydroxy-tetrahydrodipicolinate synthase